MNQLIPKYSFIKLFLPKVKKYNVDTYINHHIQSYNDSFNLNQMDVRMNLIMEEDYNNQKDNVTNSLFVRTHIEINFNHNKIDEVIKINRSDNNFKIDYLLKNNKKVIDKIDIPKFKIDSENYKILLEHYKFFDNKEHYKLFINLQKLIEH